MSVREAIIDMASFLKAAPPAWRPPKMEDMSIELSRRAAMIRAPIPHADFDALHQKFLEALDSNDWSNIDPLDWIDITYLLWTRTPNLLTINKFQINYRRFLEASKTARPFKRLIYAYLEAFDPQLEGIEWAGNLIRKILLQKRYCILDYWRNIELQLQIFSISRGPISFATHCLDHSKSVFDLHRDLGLTGILSTGGYVRHSYLHAARATISNKMESATDLIRLQRFLEWTIRDNASPLLRFPAHRTETFRALLPSRIPPRGACELLGKFFTYYAEAWRRGDPSCLEPGKEEIEIMGQILTHAIST